MSNPSWIEATKTWRKLPPQERPRLNVETIPRHVANLMAMKGEHVDEAWIREQFARRTSARAPNFQ